MFEWYIKFVYNNNIDSIFLHKLIHELVSLGVKYNIYRLGGYFIRGKDPRKDIEHIETARGDLTEKLYEIIDTYLEFDLKSTSLSIWLNYCYNDVDIPFFVTIYQEMGNSIISFGTNVNFTPDDKTFEAFINLCKNIFIKSNFSYGIYRTEFEVEVPIYEDSIQIKQPAKVTFYSKSLVEKIGRKKLLFSPVKKVEELENGGIMLLVCSDPVGCPEEMDRVAHYFR